MSSTILSTPRRRALRRKLAIGVLAAASLVGVTAGAASAKGGVEGAEGGGAGGGTATCAPVKSMGYKGDTSTADTNVATITVSYSVKACDARPVRVETSLYLSATPGSIAYSNPNAPLSGKFTAAGVKANTSYTAKVSVYDAATGSLVGSKTIFAAAVYQGV